MTDDPDRDILAFVDRGDLESALRTLMERYGTTVYRYCREMLRDAELAEDVVQRVFIQAHRDLTRAGRRSSLRTWLFGIARRCVLDGVKVRSRARSRFADLVEDAEIARNTDWVVMPNADLQIAVQRAMEQLDDWQRSLVLLRFQANLSVVEIADQAGMSTDQVRVDIGRTLGVLKKMLSEDAPEEVASGDQSDASRPDAQLLTALTSVGDTKSVATREPSSPLRQAQPRIVRLLEPRPFESIGELRAAHALLGERRAAEDGSATFLGDAEDFVKRGCATGVFLDDADERWSVQGVLDYWAAALERAGWERPESSLAEFDIERAPALPDEDCPYRGLDAFEEKDSRLFFGREAMVERLTGQLEQHRLVALVGPSGCGKSSLALAGMVARTRQRGPAGQAPWRILPSMVPGARPHDALMRLLAETTSRDADASPVLLVVDQLEELFTMCDSEGQREAFVAELLALVSSPTPHRVVLTMRSDFESFVARYPALYDHYTRGRLAITPMSAAELREAIEGPAALVGLVFESGVIDRLLHDVVGEPAGLPLLQFTLRRLWDDRRRNRVTRASYDRVGGGRQALALAADAVYGAMIPEDQRTARRILLRVGLAVDPRYELTRTRVPRSQFHGRGEDPARVDRVLDRLIDARLLRVTAYPDSPEPGIEVAHEALVRNWPRLAEWLQEAQASLLERRRLDAKVEDWIARGRGLAGVLDQVEIAEAQRWMSSEVAQQLGVRDDLRALVAASQRELERSQREAEQTRQLAEMAHQLRGAALQEQGRALLVAERPMQALPYLLAARNAIGSSPVLQMLFSQASSCVPVVTYPVNLGLITRAALSPDGELLVLSDGFATHIAATATLAPAVWIPALNGRVCAVGFRAGTVLVLTSIPSPAVHVFEVSLPRAWERRERTAFLGANAVGTAAFSTDGQWAVTTDGEHKGSLWDTTTGALIGMLPAHRAAIHRVSFGSGTSVITACADGTAQIWDASSGERRAPSLVHRDAVYDGAFSPDGARVVTACADGTAQIWDARDGTPLTPPLEHRGAVRTARFSADGLRVVTGSDDHTARVWDAVRGRPIAGVLEHPAAVHVAIFHPGGERVVTGGADRTPRLWSTPPTPSSVALAQTRVLAAALSPDGRRVVTGSEDHSARIWDATTGAALTTPLAHGSPVRAVAFSPDGLRVATAGADRTVRVWDAATGAALTAPLVHPAGVPVAVFYPATAEVAAANEADLARLWNATTGVAISPPSEDEDAIGMIAFSHDGRVLTARAHVRAPGWDARTGERQVRFSHHDGLDGSAPNPDGTASSIETAAAQRLDLESPLRLQNEHYGPVHAAARSPDGRLLATASEDRTARLWNMSTGAPASAPLEHLGAVVAVRFTPDGSRVITASRDHTVQIWDVSSGKPLTPGLRHAAPLRAIDLDVHGERLLTLDLDGLASLWDLSPGPGALEDWKRITACSPFALVDGVLAVNSAPGSLPSRKT